MYEVFQLSLVLVGYYSGVVRIISSTAEEHGVCPGVGSPPSFLVLNFDQIFGTVCVGALFFPGLASVIYKQQHPPPGEPKRLLDLVVLVQFLVCAFSAYWVIVGIALPWGSALDNWYFPAHNALAASVGNGCSLSSFTAMNDAMNGAYIQATRIQSMLTPIALTVGVCSFGVLALYGRLVRGSWKWMGRFFAQTQPAVEVQQRDA
jgi:hypothetical protein